METIRLKTNSGCPLLGTYSRFEITIPRHHRNDPSELARAPSCIFPSVPRISRARWNRNRNFLSGIMMHRAITHRLHRMHNSYVCHELWTGASTGACTPRAAMGRGVAILSFLSSFPPLLPFFSRSTAIFDPFLRHTRHNPSVVGYFRPILASFRRGNCCSGSQRVAISHEESPPFLAVNSFQPYLQTFRGEKSRFPYSFVTDRGQSSCWNIFFPRTKRNLSFPIFLFPPNCN